MSRIAIFTNSIGSMGGEQRVVCIMANEFAKKHEVTIFTMNTADNKERLYYLSPQIKIKQYFPYKGDIVSFLFRIMTHLTPWLVYDLFSPIILERAYCPQSYSKKMNALIEGNYDAVIATSWQLTIILGEVCRIYSHEFKAIGWEHNSFEAYFREKYIYLYHHENIFKKNAKYLDHVIVLNHDYAQKYKKFLDIDCQVIYNPKSFKNEKKSKLTKKHFVTCARLVYSKGLDLLIEAFNIFAKVDKEWDLFIAGDGMLKRKLEKRVSELKLGERIVFLGHVENIGELLSEMSVYLLTSRYEGFPMSVTEAFETGLPVISFDIPAMIPFKESGGAETVKCFEVCDFAEAMLNMADSYEKRYDLSKNALAFVQDLSPEKLVKYWETYIEE